MVNLMVVRKVPRSKLIIVKGEGRDRMILCFNKLDGQHWRSEFTERLSGWASARKFDTDKGAQLALGLAGGSRVEILPS